MRIDIYEPQAIWETGKQPEQLDIMYPRKGEADQADRLFILCDGKGVRGTTSAEIVRKISLYFNRYRNAAGEITDDDIRNALESAADTAGDGSRQPVQASLSMLCIHRGGITIVHTGRGKVCHIRPSEDRLLFESREQQEAYITDPAIVHVTDVQTGDYFYLCTDGMLEGMGSDDICAYFSESGSDDKKRNVLRGKTSGNADNHSAYFFKVRAVVAEPGDELLEGDEQSSADNLLSGRPAPIRKPRPAVQKPKVENAETTGTGSGTAASNGTKTARPIGEVKPQATKTAAEQQQRKPSYRQLEPKADFQRTRRVPDTYDDEHHTNMRMVLLVVLILLLAIAAGALWYFNSDSPATMPTDSIETTTPSTADSAAMNAAEPADSAIIPDSAIAEPERLEPVNDYHKRNTPRHSDYEDEYDYGDESSDETEVTEPETPANVETETPKPAAETPKASTEGNAGGATGE